LNSKMPPSPSMTNCISLPSNNAQMCEKLPHISDVKNTCVPQRQQAPRQEAPRQQVTQHQPQQRMPDVRLENRETHEKRVQLQRNETQNYDQMCKKSGDCGLTVPITRVVEQTIQEPFCREEWTKKVLPDSCTRQIKLECNQKVIVKGEKVRRVCKEVPVSRKIMVKVQVPVKRKVTRLVCVPVVKTIEVETTDVKEVCEYIEEIEDRWVEKCITETKKIDEYIREPYQKVVTIPYLQIQEVKRANENGKDCWEKRLVRGVEPRTILREEVCQEDVLATLRQQGNCDMDYA